jgi:hypothetical protein
MRSPGKVAVVARGIGLAALVGLIVLVRDPAAGDASASPRGLEAALSGWTHRAPAGIAVAFDSVPPPAATRDWLAALHRAGSRVTWTTSGLPPVAVTVDQRHEPNAPQRLRVAGPAGRWAAISDDAGPIDSVRLESGAAFADIPAATGRLTVRVGATLASADAGESAPVRPVLLLGTAGWESKFVLAALEEHGWRVGARLVVAPNIQVSQQPLTAIDTASYGAVIALDSVAARWAAEITRFAGAGGGVVLGPNAASQAAFAALRVGSNGQRTPGIAGAIRGARPRDGLPMLPVGRLTADAVPLESRNGVVAVAARRLGRARIVQIGYDDTWRWRLEADSGLAQHRDWWSGLVASVQPAFASTAVMPNESSAPVAALVAALGPSSTFSETDTRREWMVPLLFAIALLGLLTDWTARRLRGAR